MKTCQLYLIALLGFVPGYAWANPNDPAKNGILDVDGVFALNPESPGSAEVFIRFDGQADAAPAGKIMNFSLGQVSPDLGAGTPGGKLVDLDGDQDLDLVFTLRDRIVAHENVGTKSSPRYSAQQHLLATSVYFGPTGPQTSTWGTSVTFADLDDDDDLDMICGEGYQGQVTCFYRSNDPGWPSPTAFGPQKQIRQSSGGNSFPIEVSNADGGWNLDLAVPNLALQDLNGDQIPDLILGDSYNPWGPPANITFYPGTGTVVGGAPVFGSPVALKVGGANISVEWSLLGSVCPVFHNIDGDDDLDLLVSTSSGEVWVYRAIGTNEDTGSDNFGLPLFGEGFLLREADGDQLNIGRISSLQLADFTDDGDDDLVITSTGHLTFEENRVRVVENQSSTGLFFGDSARSIGVSGYQGELKATITSKAAFFDFDSDGKMDVLYADKGYGIAIAYNLDTGNNHQPTYASPVAIPMTEGFRDTLSQGVPDIADFDNDGVLDPGIDGIVIGTETGLVFMKFVGLQDDGIPLFADPASILPAGFPVLHFFEPSVGDINGDTKLDIILGTGSLYSGESRTVKFMLNSSANGFSLGNPTEITVGSGPSYGMFPEVADYDQDGDADILITDGSASFNSRQIAGSNVRILRNDVGLNNSLGAFHDAGLLATSAGVPVAVALDASARVLDFDNDRDGKLDVLITSRSSNITSYLATGEGVSLASNLGPANPLLSVSATLPSRAELSATARGIALDFPTYVSVGGKIDINDMSRNSIRCSSRGIPILDYMRDLDGDGLFDGWEFFHFGSLNQTPGTIVYPGPTGDGLTNKEKADLGLDPTKDYSTGDSLEKVQYDYDLAGRLTTVTAPVGGGTYTPDNEGNITDAN